MAFRSSTVNTGNDTAPIGNKPAGTVDGDWLLAWVVCDFPGNITSAPSGWTLVQDANLTGPDGHSAKCYSKVAASEGASWAWGTGGSDWKVIVGAWSGRNTGGSLISAVTQNTSSNTSPISVGLTGVTALSGDDLAWFAVLDQLTSTDVWGFSGLAGFTEKQDSNSAWQTTTLYTQDNVGAGATGTLTATATQTSGSNTAGFAGVVVALPASTSGPGSGSDVSLIGVSESSSNLILVNIREETS